MSSAPIIPRYTIADYQQWQGQWELIEGVAVSMIPSPYGPHERIVSRLSRMIGNQLESFRCQCEVYTNLDWIVSGDTVVRPDLMVVCGSQPDRYLEEPPEVVIEVLSRSTIKRDRSAKLAIYRDQRVPYCLFVDFESIKQSNCSRICQNASLARMIGLH